MDFAKVKQLNCQEYGRKVPCDKTSVIPVPKTPGVAAVLHLPAFP